MYTPASVAVNAPFVIATSVSPNITLTVKESSSTAVILSSYEHSGRVTTSPTNAPIASTDRVSSGLVLSATLHVMILETFSPLNNTSYSI